MHVLYISRSKQANTATQRYSCCQDTARATILLRLYLSLQRIWLPVLPSTRQPINPCETVLPFFLHRNLILAQLDQSVMKSSTYENTGSLVPHTLVWRNKDLWVYHLFKWKSTTVLAWFRSGSSFPPKDKLTSETDDADQLLHAGTVSFNDLRRCHLRKCSRIVWHNCLSFLFFMTL